MSRMKNTMSSGRPTRAVVTVTEMANRVGLSRGHFSSLVRSGVMPAPARCPRTGRPLFTKELQEQALAVRETGVGANGEYVVFYAARRQVSDVAAPMVAVKPEHVKTERAEDDAIVQGLRALGLTATKDQVRAAVAACYPGGLVSEDEGVVLRTLWAHLRHGSAAEDDQISVGSASEVA